METPYIHKRGSREIETLPVELKRYPSDLLQSFLSTSPNTTLRRHNSLQSPEPEKEELNLGLSLDGRFGVDKSHKGLVRSSSVAAALPREEEDAAAAAAALVRTASLPPEMEEEWRKRKEIQSLRRLEAKRKRSEKQRSIIKGNGLIENLNLSPDLPGKSNPGYGYPVHWASSEAIMRGGFCGDLQGLNLQHHKQDVSQGSGESQEASKSSASESERNTNQGSSCGTRNSEASSENQIEASDHQKKAREGENGIGDMPCVFTIGDGPRGRKVEGILYRYKKGEEVRIMCVCHGGFFTPAEFVNHAGARNVAHPLKRIVVNPNPSPFS